MLTGPSRVPQNPFQNNKSRESYITANISIGKFKNTCPSVLAIVTERILLTLPLLHIRTIRGVISWYVLALQRLFHFIACVSFLSISLFLLIFLWSLLLAEVLRYVCQYL